MKIAIAIEQIEAWRGGAETSTWELATLLAQRGHEIHILTTALAPSPPGMTIHRISVTGILRPLKTQMFARRTAQFLKRHDFDVVLAISPVLGADVYQPRGGLLGETMERNVATRPTATQRAMKRTLMAMNAKRRALLRLEGEIFRDGGPMIAAVSQYVVRQCEKYYRVGPPRVREIFNGVNPAAITEAERAAARQEIRQQYQVEGDTLLLLFVAHNFRLKGLYPLIETASALVVGKFTDFRVLVVGRDNPVHFQRRVASAGLERFATFTGPTQRISSFFHAADVLVHPTYYDPCSRVVLEALWHGLPCITTAFNGAAEVIRDGIEGFVIDTPDNIGLWARRIRELQSPELRRKITNQAVLLRERISMGRHVAELDALLKEAAHQRRHSQRRSPPAGHGNEHTPSKQGS